MKQISAQLQSKKTTSLVLMLLMSFSLSGLFSHFTLAQEAPSNVAAPSQTDSSVQNPGLPHATSEPNDYALTWAWSMPDGGLTPDAIVDPENPDVPPAAQPTDIILFGYEFSKQGAVVSRGEVNSLQYSLETPVTTNGTYNLKVWSITREGLTSVAAEGSIIIAKTVATPLPVIDEQIIPKPIDTSGVIKKQANSESVIPKPVPINSGTSANSSPLKTVNPEVLSATEEAESPVALDTVAVVKPSNQGWVILGVAWYVWLLILAGVAVAGKGVMAFVNARS